MKEGVIVQIEIPKEAKRTSEKGKVIFSIKMNT